MVAIFHEYVQERWYNSAIFVGSQSFEVQSVWFVMQHPGKLQWRIRGKHQRGVAAMNRQKKNTATRATKSDSVYYYVPNVFAIMISHR